MNFPTMYRERISFFSNPGSRIHEILSPVFDRNGHLTLEVSGEENIYDQIQSHKDSCDIHVLMKQYVQGDMEALSRRQAVFADVTEMPKSYAEMLQAMITAEQYFNSLPVEVRAKFNHSVNEFIAGMDKEDFFEKLGKVPKPDSASDSAPDSASDSASASEGGEQQ